MKFIQKSLFFIKTTLVLGVFFILSSCDKNQIFEQYKDLPHNFWHTDSAAVFTFRVTDTKRPHNIYYNIRNTISYPYYNIYVQYELADSSGMLLRANLHEANLMHHQTGEPFGENSSPLGQGVGSFYSHRILLLPQYKFEKEGVYQLKLRQYMRLDSLAEITAVGARVEYADQK